MKRRIIAIDVDDVIADSLEGIRKRVNERLGLELTSEQYRIDNDYWDYLENVWNKHGIVDKVSFEDHEAEMIVDQSHMELLPGAGFAIAELGNRFDIAIITARSPEWEAATLKWLNGHFGDMFIGVHFTGAKERADFKPKGLQARELGAEWLIDDSPTHCQTALDVGVNAILFGDYGWHIDVPEGTFRCKDWQAVLEYFNGVR